MPASSSFIPITYDDALRFFRLSDLTSELEHIRPDPPTKSCLAPLLCRGPPKLHSAHVADRNALFAIALVPFQVDTPEHGRMLSSSYMSVLGARAPPPALGPHWETMGFQGDNPATDLRSCGMLALLHLLYVSDVARPLVLEWYSNSRSSSAGFPFATVSIRMTKLVIEALREGKLTAEINRRQDVFAVTSEFYSATFMIFNRLWAASTHAITEFSEVERRVAAIVKNAPGRVMEEFQAAISARTQASGSGGGGSSVLFARRETAAVGVRPGGNRA